MRTVPMFASPVVYTRRRTLAAQLGRTYCGIRHLFSRDLIAHRDALHPCWTAAHFLPCTRPPDGMRLYRPQRGRIHHGPSERRAFVSTRSGLQTMPTGQGEDEIEEDTVPAAAVTGAAAGPGRRYGAAAGPGRRFTAVTAQDAHGPTTATGDPKDSPTATILTPQLFRSTTSALTKSFLTPTSISSVTPTPDLPSCPLLASSSLSLPPTPMSRPNFFASMSCCWERTAIFFRRALCLEGCCFAYVFLFAFVFGGLDQPLFATRWSCHFCFEILISL